MEPEANAVTGDLPETIHIIKPDVRLSINSYDPEDQVNAREPEGSFIRHAYAAWRLVDGADVPRESEFSAFDLTNRAQDMRNIRRATLDWPYSIERRIRGLSTHETLLLYPPRDVRMIVVLAACKETIDAIYEEITEVRGEDESIYRRIYLPVVGEDGTVSAVYIIQRGVAGHHPPMTPEVTPPPDPTDPFPDAS